MKMEKMARSSCQLLTDNNLKQSQVTHDPTTTGGQLSYSNTAHSIMARVDRQFVGNSYSSICGLQPWGTLTNLDNLMWIKMAKFPSATSSEVRAPTRSLHTSMSRRNFHIEMISL